MDKEIGKILIVDDEIEIVSLIKEYLTKKGFTVVSANSGEQAVSVYKKEKT